MSIFGQTQVLFDPSNMSAFGRLQTNELTPIVQGDFIYGLNTQLWTSAASGTGATVDTNAGRARIQCGTSNTNYAYVVSKKPIKYRAGQGVEMLITPVFGTAQASNIQLWGAGTVVSNAPYDGYFFGYNGTSFGIAHYIAGTPTWYTQTSDWNGDKVDGTAGTTFTWNKQYGTPTMIKYPFLGYGDIEFFVQNPSSGRWVLVHTIRYANTTASIQITNPSLNVIGYTKNSGNTTNVIMYSGSVGTFVSGLQSYESSPRWAMDSIKTGISTETNMITLKNCSTYNGEYNRGVIRINGVNFGTNSNAYTTVRFKTNATLGGSPSYTTINGTTADGGATITSGNSITSYDVAGTTVTGGTYIYNFSGGSQGSINIDLTDKDILVYPGDTLTISLTGSAATAGSLSVNWTEDI